MVEAFFYVFAGFIFLAVLSQQLVSVLARRGEELMVRLEERLLATYRFKPTQRYIGSSKGIAIDEESGRICLIREPYGRSSLKVLRYGAIVESEIIENGISVTRTSRSGQIGGALLGGLVLGGVGAVIGGLSAKKTTTNRVRSVDLRVVVNDTKEPVHLVRFPTRAAADHWQALLTVAIRRNDREVMEGA